MTRIRATKRAALLLLACVAVMPAARADTITFRPDPLGAPGQTFQISGFDQLPGSGLVIDATPLPIPSGDRQVLFQAQMSNVLPNQSLPGLGTTYQILSLANFPEKLIPIDPTALTVGTADPNPNATNTVQLWYRPNIGANPINEKTGAGYAPVPGDLLILAGRVTSVSGTTLFGDPQPVPYPQLDQTVGTGPADIETAVFTGDFDLGIAVTYINSLFFPDPTKTITDLSVNGSIAAPFDQVTPNMGQFWNGYSRNINGVNAVDPSDVEFQTDASTNLLVIQQTEVTVPEPGTVALLLLGLGGAGARRWLRRCG